ncbi:E3 ubiquitin-protein ligase ariadne-1-like [Watersipora subatra]|uniref:E3 ubiquitin-protein ligase ariadne-1-like n=1 Tax=Watersipora subatra TaxID=2589382 RepID=UPI00355C5F91
MAELVPVSETDSGSDFSDQTSDNGTVSLYLKSGSAQSLNEEAIVEILDSATIVKNMRKTLSDVADIVGEDLTVTRLLLSHFHWDTQSLLERFYDRDKKELFAEASIHYLHKQESEEKLENVYGDASQEILSDKELTKPDSKSGDEMDCGICLTPISTESFQLPCQHKFCSECWMSYLRHIIMSEGVSQNINCPAYDCNTLIGDEKVMELVQDLDVKVKYQQAISRSYVNCNKSLRWCPGPGCDRAIRECPKCAATIEKDGGCNHMTCRTESCRYEFCWVCMGSWQDHGQNAWYRCNRFNEKASKDARTAMDKSRANMLRFLHYYSRFSNHEQSMKLESDLYNKVNGKIAELRYSQGQVWNEVKYLKAAVDVLCRARQILMNTYIFAYFVVQNNQSMMFEDNQRDLELSTEQLSEYLEREIFKDGVEGLKQKVNDKASYCGKRCAVLVSHIQEGYENGWWVLSTDRCRGPSLS